MEFLFFYLLNYDKMTFIMKKYDHKKIEKKWQDKWEQSKIYKAEDNSSKPKYYAMIEFPYPSGQGLHVGHIRSNTAMDIIARKRRSEGFNVLYPIGWDAFGLPTENYAIKTGIHPIEVTKQNTDRYRKQLKSIGFSFDWDREINTTDPEYYRWTQWIFLQLLKEGLAYKKKMLINWCISCKIGLANEEVVNGKCERCGGEIEKREKEQWMLAITKYADRLDKDLDDVDYLEKIKIQQRNWIGKSKGAHVEFSIKDFRQKIKVFTTRPDTLFGATYMVLAPEHKLIEGLKDKVENWDEVENYVKEARKKSEIDRTDLTKEKTGVEIKGVKAINPSNQKEIPIFIADYVLDGYGTGAIMSVPAHDKRDWEFAKKFGLEIIDVISGRENDEKAYINDALLINSGEFDGIDSKEAKQKITEFVGGEMTTNYKLRDWIFSRQRYWGEPIPVVHCDKCGIVPVLKEDLPVKLPNVKNYQPTNNGESPLANIEEWVNTVCPKCGGAGKRETDTMPNWAGSSWYFLRYIDPKNNESLADKDKLKYWTPVDWYNGGMEHTTLHLLYSRFWHKFLFDIGVVPTSEPYQKRTSHGMILAEGGVKMSKSKGNVVNPDDVVGTFGADTFRLYEMFMGPFDQSIVWSTDNMVGPRRFLERVWNIHYKLKEKHEDKKLLSLIHKATKKVSIDIEEMKFNTAISQMMILVNEMEKKENVSKRDFEMFLKILAPFAPHITEEIWENLGYSESIHLEEWPKYDEELAKDEKHLIVLQVNGKVRSEIEIEDGESEEIIKEKAFKDEKIQKWVEGKEIRKTIYISNKLINIVI